MFGKEKKAENLTKDWGLQHVNPLGPGHYDHQTEFRMGHRSLNSNSVMVSGGMTTLPTTLNTNRNLKSIEKSAKREKSRSSSSSSSSSSSKKVKKETKLNLASDSSSKKEE